MREIKFRAWDNLKKEMYKPVYKAYESNLFYLTLNIDSGVLLAHEMKGVCSASKDLDERFELMQYTGLKDKNGEEIYEEDIVRFASGNIDSEYTVRYDEYYFGYMLKKEGIVSIGLEKYFKLEVIGNIYENPELLKVKK